MDELLQTISRSVRNGELPEVVGDINKAIRINIPANEILNMALIPAIAKADGLYKDGKYYFPEMLVLAMKAGLEVLNLLLEKEQVRSKRKVVIGAAKGDPPDNSKSLIVMLLEGTGFEVSNLCGDIVAKTNDASMLTMSVLHTKAISNIKAVIDTYKEAGLRDAVKIMACRVSATQVLYTISADIFSLNAGQAPCLVKSWA